MLNVADHAGKAATEEDTKNAVEGMLNFLYELSQNYEVFADLALHAATTYGTPMTLLSPTALLCHPGFWAREPSERWPAELDKLPALEGGDQEHQASRSSWQRRTCRTRRRRKAEGGVRP